MPTATEQLKQANAVKDEALLAASIWHDSPRMWWALWCHQNAAGITLDFIKNRWLHALYIDNAEQIVIPKSSKTFVTEWLLADMLTMALRGLNGMYILPDQPIRNRFVTTRVDPIIRNLPEFEIHAKETAKSVHEKGLKTLFRGSQWAFVGAMNPDTFYEFDADMLIYDEFDKCNPISVAVSKDRTLAAGANIWRKVGNPTFEDFGIEKEYAKSDCKVWMVKCQHCNEWQELDWFENFVEKISDVSYQLKSSSKRMGVASSGNSGEDASALCRYCSRPIDRLGEGAWVAKHPGITVSGYRISRLFWQPEQVSGRAPIIEMFDAFCDALHNQTELQLFYNNRLGLPYTAVGSRIDENILAACADKDCSLPLSATGTCAGVDIGKQLHVHISKLIEGRRQKVYIGIAVDYADLGALCKRYGVISGVMDAGPEIHEPREFCRRHSGWYLCRYNKSIDDKVESDGKHGDWFVRGDFRYNPVAHIIAANRTESLDISFNNYLDRRVLLPHDWRSVDNGAFVKQMTMPVRVKQERADGTFYYVWTKGEDHHRHADNYERMAATLMSSGSSMVKVFEV